MIRKKGRGFMMNNQENKNVKKDTLEKFEVEGLKNKFKELENLDDLWYLVKSSSGSWIAGSAK